MYRAQGRYLDAEPLYQRSLRIREKALGPEHPNVAAALKNLVALYARGSDPKDALEPLQKLLDRSLRHYGLFHWLTLHALEQLSVVHQHLGQKQEQGAVFARFLSELARTAVPAKGLEEDVRSTLAELLERSFFHVWLERRFDEAEKIVAQVAAMPLAKDTRIAAARARMQSQVAAVPLAERKLLSTRAAFAKGRNEERLSL